jgi:hypothetical protein
MKLHVAIINHEQDRHRDSFVVIAKTRLQLKKDLVQMVKDFYGDEPDEDMKTLLAGLNTRTVEGILEDIGYLVNIRDYWLND